MTTIGVIDDRDADRKMIVTTINFGNKEDGWKVVDNAPLEDLSQYPAWIAENKINALVIDERLDEATNNGKAVDYQGHDLVEFVRKHVPTLPIFVITAYSSDLPLQDKFKDVEGIIDRREYGRNYSNYVPRIIRSAQQYLSAFQEELNQLSVFAQKAAIGEIINEDERRRVEAIRTKLGIAYPIESISGISKWVNEATNLIDNLEGLRQEVEKRLGKDK